MAKTDLECLEIDGAQYKTTFNKKWINRKKWEVPDPNKIFAHIPGTIMKINIKEGQEVEGNDLLLILQAMKMDNRITAPFSAKVKKIYVKEGEKIPRGTLMVELEE